MIKVNVTSLYKQFGTKKVLSDLSFHSHASVLGVSGFNGSGKSTLLKCLSGLLKPTSGSIVWEIKGKKSNPHSLRDHLGYVAPYIQLYEELTILENLKFLMDVHKNVKTHSISESLSQFGAENLATTPYGSLSTGQQQRAKLAAAIFHQPNILILDEPGSNLDEKGKKSVTRLIESFSAAKKMVIIASNQPYELDICDQIIDLNNN